VLHFSLIFIYANSPVTIKNKWEYYAQWYVYPFFHQNWNLFAPPPDTNYKLFAEFESNGIQRADIFNEVLIEHQSNRLKGYGPLVLAFANSIHYFEKNTKLVSEFNGPITNDLYFKIVEYTANKYLKYAHNITGDKIKLVLVVEDTNKRERKIYFN
jgi:hypothetical protein